MADERNPSSEEKLAAEIDKAKDLKVGELKMKLQAIGVLTSTFCEKSEFVRAYAESIVCASERAVAAENTEDVDDKDQSAASKFPNENDEDEEAGLVDQLPAYIQRRVGKLTTLHEEREQIVKEYLIERAKLESKYQALTEPLYQKRTGIVSGKLDGEISEDFVDVKGEEGEELEKGVPQFWVLALAHMEVIADLLTESDITCLESLEDVVCVDDAGGQGFTLSFQFRENDYFENMILTKKYEVPNLLFGDEPILKNVEGCEIKWKPDMCLTFTDKTQKQRGKGNNAGQIRIVKKEEKKDSFFHFFTPPKLPSMDSMDEEEAQRLESAFDADYDIAQAFRSHIVPKAVLWYSGHALEQELEDVIGEMQWPGGIDN